ncbi:flagellar assembly protein FliH [Steroidobacter sp. S1-65]|uniref:Flagellar assembly protein FliH n=1 Tax=Steroidobacter gossypii TaxID=2805490 RepID=A0ABS1X525_9GAMM|nr:flagellar assembly protein FliH [Steroidobacter gossypii]MBM0108323.1 flagellar assembly protein FliH [Steroidobacter gossypii]
MTTAARYELPSISGLAVQGRRAGKTVQELEDLEQRTYDEAFAKGMAEGRAQGLAAIEREMRPQLQQLQAHVERLDAVVSSLARPLQELDPEVEAQLLQLALTIGRHLVRRELRIDPSQVIAIIRETVALLPASARDVRVHLHPEDAAVVREKLATPSGERVWTIAEDPVMGRGGCRVTTDTAQIDARLETRIGSVISALLGDERVTSVRGDDAASAESASADLLASDPDAGTV